VGMMIELGSNQFEVEKITVLSNATEVMIFNKL
jgi:hypothetical protein